MRIIDIVIKVITLVLNIFLLERTITEGFGKEIDNASLLIMIYDVLYWVYLIVV